MKIVVDFLKMDKSLNSDCNITRTMQNIRQTPGEQILKASEEKQTETEPGKIFC